MNKTITSIGLTVVFVLSLVLIISDNSYGYGYGDTVGNRFERCMDDAYESYDRRWAEACERLREEYPDTKKYDSRDCLLPSSLASSRTRDYERAKDRCRRRYID